MNEKKLKIISEAVCGFNVAIDMQGNMKPEISTGACEETCDYCRMFAEHICKLLEEGYEDGK